LTFPGSFLPDTTVTSSSTPEVSLAASFGIPVESYSYLSSEAPSVGLRSSGTGNAPKYASGSVEYDVKPDESLIVASCEKNSRARSVRLFLSSTFKDMSKERELLVKKVFPEIRRLCASRFVNFVYIDFRWGITSEESAGGKVLDLCLTEIDKCRPYFVGILGQRYGWSQQSSSITDRTLSATFEDAAVKHPWVESYQDRSITEVEMLYGALFHPKLSNAQFYLRDASYLDTLDSITRRDYEPQSHGEADRLADLKARIEASELPSSSYDSPEEFATLVLNDLTAAINRDFPVEEASQLDEWDLQKSVQWNAAQAHSDLYVTRNAFDGPLSRIIEDSSASTIALHGPVGCGKTALLCNWASKANAGNVSQDAHTPYIILRIIGMFSVKIHKVVMSILVELKRQFGIDKSVPADKEEILHTLSEWLTLASIKRPIVLVLDGIEKLESTAQALNWLPIVLPPKVTIVLTCPDESKPLQVLLQRETKGQAYCTPIGDMKESERREMAVKFLDQFSKKLAHEQVYLLTSTKNSSNPLFLRSVLELLRTFGDYDRLTEYLTNLMRARTLEELLAKSVEQWVTDYALPDYPDFVKDFFGVLYASRGGMLESELSSMLGVSQQSVWSSLLDATSFVLRNQAGLLYFANDHIKNAIRIKLFDGAEPESPQLKSLLSKYRSLIMAFFDAKPLSHRKIFDYPFQVVQLGLAATTLPSFLSDLKVFEQLYTEANKLDLFSYWQATEGSNAADLYRKALENPKSDVKSMTGPARAELLANLGRFLHDYGKASEAGYFYELSLSLFESAFGSKSMKAGELLHRYAMLKETLGSYKEAFDLATRCHEIFKTHAGLKSPKTASAVWLQGLLQKKMGFYEKAIDLFNSALTTAESYYGTTHPIVAVYLRTLADVYRNQALYDKAGELYERALAINKSTFGDVHPEVAEVLSNLGRIEKKRGNYDNARPLYEQAMAILIQLFGKDHMVVAEVYVQMGDVYRKIGESAKCEDLYKKALAIFRPQLGDDHPDVGEILYLLSLSYKGTGDYEASMECSRQAIAIAEKAFGPDHLKVASPLGSLADVLSIIAKYSQAIELYERALAIHTAKLGPDHPECSENLNAIGMIWKKLGNYIEANKNYRRSLDIVEKVFGPNHPKVAMYVHNLGVIYRKLKQHASSKEAFQRAMKINVETFGADHPLVAGNMVGIALSIVKSGGNLDEARDMLLKTIEIFTSKLGPTHEKVALSLNYLAEVYRKQGLFGRGHAETTYEKALKINQQAYGEFTDHPEIAENMNGLAQVYTAQLNYTKAEPMFRSAIAMSERTLGVNHIHVINRYRNLAKMYQAQGLVDKAKSTFEKVETLSKMAPIVGD
jgi:tetratricopeptide (TPR) repeat protein